MVYNNGSHIGIYLGDGRVLSAITSGVTVHSLRGITAQPTQYLKVDWTGEGGPLADPSLFEDVPEAPASLIAPLAWVPLPTSEEAANEAGRARDERIDMRTANSRTYANSDGTFTTEFHAQPIFHQPAELDRLGADRSPAREQRGRAGRLPGHQLAGGSGTRRCQRRGWLPDA